MKAVIINSYGGAEVLQYADIETPQIKSDQQRLSLDCNCSEVVFSSSRIVLSHAYILIRIRKRFANSLPLSEIASHPRHGIQLAHLSSHGHKAPW